MLAVRLCDWPSNDLINNSFLSDYFGVLDSWERTSGLQQQVLILIFPLPNSSHFPAHQPYANYSLTKKTKNNKKKLKLNQTKTSKTETTETKQKVHKKDKRYLLFVGQLFLDTEKPSHIHERKLMLQFRQKINCKWDFCLGKKGTGECQRSRNII